MVNIETMIQTNLKQSLKEFKGAATNDDLVSEFRKLAPTFLYGGYIKVGDVYRIYIHTVEFYFHAEEGSPYDISDPIVYHRNGRYGKGNLLYFPLMTLHAHASGYDITFENEKLKYRASVLIRAYRVYDVKKGEFLETKKGSRFDDRSTYLYDFINGFPIDGTDQIKWVDETENVPHELKPAAARRNVFVTVEGVRKRDMRLWSFSRANL